jgi:ribosome-binding factor A
MELDKRQREELLAHCGALNEDDAIPPNELQERHCNARRLNRKARQLCQQVAETLSLVLSGEFDDEQLQSLLVVAVEPAPNAAQLLVTLQTDGPCNREQAEEISAKLEAVSGRLRCEVAASITRKRAPRLMYRIV